jgi:uncharacterized protein YkwD
LSPDRRHFAPLLLAALLLACSTKGGASPESSRTSAGSASSDAAVTIATLTPQPTLLLPSPTLTPTASPLPSATPPPTDTPVPPTDTPSPTATETQTPTPSPTPTPTPTPTVTPTPILIGGIELSQYEQALFAKHNEIRADEGIPPLSLDATLMDVARERAQTMADTGEFTHYAPNGDTVFDLLDDAGYPWSDATENIHYNDVALSAAVSFAMNEYGKSPVHYANVIDPGFLHIGIGFVTSASGVHYISIVFTD